MLDDFECPDKSCKYNFLLDTAAFNKLAEHSDWLSILEQSLVLEFHYYKTANQDFELMGQGAKTYDKDCIPHVDISESFKAKMPLFDEVKERLKVK